MWKIVLALMLMSGVAIADTGTPVVTTPQPVSSTGGNASSTITQTSTFQQLWAATTARRGCTIINNGTHTMWVWEGLSGTATTGTAVPLAANQPYYCGNPGGTVLYGAIWITGTATDGFYAVQY